NGHPWADINFLGYGPELQKPLAEGNQDGPFPIPGIEAKGTGQRVDGQVPVPHVIAELPAAGVPYVNPLLMDGNQLPAGRRRHRGQVDILQPVRGSESSPLFPVIAVQALIQAYTPYMPPAVFHYLIAYLSFKPFRRIPVPESGRVKADQ